MKKKVDGLKKIAMRVKRKAINAAKQTMYMGLWLEEPPHYWFDYQAHRTHFPGDYFYGDFDCTPIWTESIGFFCHNILNKSTAAPTIFDEYEEISIEEYDEAMDAMIKEL